MGSQSFASGGKINGKGGPKSDSINMKAKKGSFIVPAENAEEAMNLGKELLGWKDNENASKGKGDTKIRTSNGEVMFTPEEVGILKYHGVSLDALAPNSNPENKIGFAEGGVLGKDFRSDSTYLDYEYRTSDSGKLQYKKPGTSDWKVETSQNAINEYNSYMDSQLVSGAPEQKEFKYENPTNQTPIMTNVDSPAIKNITLPKTDIPEGKSKKEDRELNLFKYAPELASAIQIAGGSAGLMNAGKKPDLTISNSLQQLSAETRRLANFGYEPSVINSIETQIENTRRSISKSITDQGGSPMEQMAKLQNLLSTTIGKKSELAFANAKEKARKWADVLKIDTIKAGQEFDINKMDIADWYRNQEVFSELLSSGISNLVGAQQCGGR